HFILISHIPAVFNYDLSVYVVQFLVRRSNLLASLSVDVRRSVKDIRRAFKNKNLIIIWREKNTMRINR
ncbi:15321_t:CDS:1, partial [Gigaspora rosea]